MMAVNSPFMTDCPCQKRSAVMVSNQQQTEIEKVA